MKKRDPIAEMVATPEWKAMQSALDRVDGQDGVALVERACEQIGYGRVIQIAQQAWYRKSKREMPHMDELGHLCASRIACVWCYVDSRTGKKVPKPRRKAKGRRAK